MDKKIFSTLLALSNIIKDSTTNNVDFIRYKYQEDNSNFDETFETALKLQLIQQVEGYVTLQNQQNSQEKVIKESLSRELLSNEDVQNFFRTFHLDSDSGKYVARLSESELILYSNIRKILVDIDLISIEDNYYVAQNLDFVNRKTYSIEQLTGDLRKKEQIGKDAELLVLEFEKAKIKKYSNLRNIIIEHTSQIDVSAGYDIKSFNEECAEIYYEPKYIEVKAVGKNDCFYWSRNEILVAKLLEEKYFLYLVRIDNNSVLSLENLQIINNPYKRIFMNDVWIKECESYKIVKGQLDE